MFGMNAMLWFVLFCKIQARGTSKAGDYIESDRSGIACNGV